ncbi:camp-binding protein [Leptolyngbya sp. Heron Island J]|uniref:Crp/Fnr family transcriptional regulator n=1 Tax=Leptolyngbya sp. Heron Island J TaxID=1385935 RepID=UPI0003B99B35|nr:Crp/Fnr family transcriptional regulator [Leptolyngbya sp. Heron Island J]ESA33173.1 camp-binding protein [Leptolyngbya sp. Heron Island J]
MESLDSYMRAFNRLFEQRLIDRTPSLLTLKAGEVVFHAEDPAERIFGVKTGKIQLVRYLDNGQMSYQYPVNNGAWFGERALFNDVYSSSAIATTPSQLIAIPKQNFLALLRYEPEMSVHFTEQLTEQLHIAKNLMTVRCIRSARDRVLVYLHSLKRPGQNTCVLESPLKAIAEQICLTPEVVSRSLRKLQDDGTIQRNQRKITFLKG